MAVSATQVSTLCTGSEILLVRASRPPELNLLSPAELKRLAVRARKLADKWLDQSRREARIMSRQVGSGATRKNTRLKVQIFTDAHKSFAARLAKFELAPAAVKSPRKTKKVRNAGHRAARAKVRKALARH